MNRKREAEGTPFTDLTLCPDSAAVALHNGPGDVETESDTSPIILGHLKKPHKDGFQFLRRDSDAGVSDRKTNLVSEAFDVNDNSPVSRRELHRIAQKIGEHLKNPCRIKRGK